MFDIGIRILYPFYATHVVHKVRSEKENYMQTIYVLQFSFKLHLLSMKSQYQTCSFQSNAWQNGSIKTSLQIVSVFGKWVAMPE
jgi:hypothetical protein